MGIEVGIIVRIDAISLQNEMGKIISGPACAGDISCELFSLSFLISKSVDQLKIQREKAGYA